MAARRIPTLALLLCALTLAVGCTTVPITGRTQLQLIGEKQEIQLGLTAFQEAMGKLQVSSNGPANAVVTRVAQRISAVADAHLRKANRMSYSWETRLVQSGDRNAFALPGGKIIVYEGLLGVTANEAQLATVVAHEVAHALARHGAERLSQGLLVSAGAVAAGVAVKDEDGFTQAAVLAAYSIGTTIGVMLPYSRAHEREADYIGLILMAQAGYDPAEAVAFWARFADANKNMKKPPEFLSTHPSDATRIKTLQAQLPEAQKTYASMPSRLGKGLNFR